MDGKEAACIVIESDDDAAEDKTMGPHRQQNRRERRAANHLVKQKKAAHGAAAAAEQATAAKKAAEAEQANTVEEAIVISDTEEGTDSSLVKQKGSSSSLEENPMYSAEDAEDETKNYLLECSIAKAYQNEEFESDGLLQRLKKKLSQAKTLKEQQSVETLIQKRRDKLGEGKTPSQNSTSKEPKESCFKMPSGATDAFKLRETVSKDSFWSLGSGPKRRIEEADVTALGQGCDGGRPGKRTAGAHEKELMETMKDMETEVLKRNKARRVPLVDRIEPSTLGARPSQRQDETFVWPGKPSLPQQHVRNPGLRPVGEKSAEQRTREAGLAARLGPENKGFTMLAAMGYQPGAGLGREGEGMREPVGIAVRRGKEGFGS